MVSSHRRNANDQHSTVVDTPPQRARRADMVLVWTVDLCATQAGLIDTATPPMPVLELPRLAGHGDSVARVA